MSSRYEWTKRAIASNGTDGVYTIQRLDRRVALVSLSHSLLFHSEILDGVCDHLAAIEDETRTPR